MQFDLASMDRFDRDTGEIEVKLSSKCVTITGAQLPGTHFAVFINKVGTCLILKEDGRGYPVRRVGKGDASRTIFCTAAIAALAKRGVQIPQKTAGELQDGMLVVTLKKNEEDKTNA